MTFTLTFAWWWIPAAFTLIGLIWAISIDDRGGYISGFGNLLAVMFVLVAATPIWIIAGVLR